MCVAPLLMEITLSLRLYEFADFFGNCDIYRTWYIDIVFSVTYYLELSNVINICCLFLSTKIIHWLFGHHRT